MYAVELLPSYDCVTCTDAQKIERGCEIPVEGPYVISIDGEQQTRCPRRPILEEPVLYGNIFWLFRQYKAGYLVEPGGLNDQPEKLMQCFKVIETATGRVEKEKERQKALKRKRGNKAGRGPVGKPVTRRRRRK